MEMTNGPLGIGPTGTGSKGNTSLRQHISRFQHLERDELMQQTNGGYAIFRHYLGNEWKPSKNFQNPFREKQETVSFNIYRHENGTWMFHDFATGDKGSGFDLVMRLQNLSYGEAVQRIAQDLGITSGVQHAGKARHTSQAVVAATRPAPTVAKNSGEAKYRQAFLPDEVAYWDAYGITVDILQTFGVKAVESYSRLNKKGEPFTIYSKPGKRIYAYSFGEAVKLYIPKAEKGFKFQWLKGGPGDFLFGFDELPASGNRVFIAAGEKDVMALAANNCPAVTLNSETADLTDEVVRKLRRFETIYICYDLDETGRKNAEEKAAQHDLQVVVLPDELLALGGKDVSDLFAAIRAGHLPKEAFEHVVAEAKRPLLTVEPLAMPTSPRPKPGGHLPTLLHTEEKLRLRTEKDIVFQKALFRHKDEEVIWPRTINMIQGQYGVHKSRLAELFAAVFLTVGIPGFDTLGVEFQSEAGESYKLVYVDTERNISDQFPFALQRIKDRAGIPRDAHPASFAYTSLIHIPREQRFTALREYLVHLRQDFTGHMLVILDVVPDCVQNFNDVEASNELIDLLNEVVNEQNVTFLVVIHENPGGMKARGHLGTELGNKASTILQIGFLKNESAPRRILELNYLKRRYGSPDFTVYAEYDPETKGLVTADPTAEELAQKQRVKKASLAEVVELLPEMLRVPKSAGKLAEELGARLEVSPRTIAERLKALVQPGALGIVDEQGRLCRLVKEEHGKETLYFLEPLPPDVLRG